MVVDLGISLYAPVVWGAFMRSIVDSETISWAMRPAIVISFAASTGMVSSVRQFLWDRFSEPGKQQVKVAI